VRRIGPPLSSQPVPPHVAPLMRATAPTNGVARMSEAKSGSGG
jgi:hypothetical protein